MDDVRKLPGLKAGEITKSVTGKGVGSDGPVFYRVTVETCCIDPLAVQRQAGLELLVGNAAIAQALGPDEHMAKIFASKVAFVTISELEDLFLAQLLED